MVSSLVEPGFRLGKYEVSVHLATGGMGSVYQARDIELGRIVALKVLSADLAKNDLIMERFRREARHAARLNHPNIVTIYECGHDPTSDLHFLALELVDGKDLARILFERGKLRPEETRRILMQTAKALAHAFEHGIVHRDIKPSNLMLARVAGKPVVKLTDLGLAMTQEEDDFRLTREGHTVGTIDYMAPEQARDSRSTDTRSDIYSLGCTAYHLLAGKAPFAEGGLGERLFKHLEVPPTDVRQFNADVSTGLWRIIAKMLAKKPEDRYANPNELLRALKRTRAEGVAPPLESTTVKRSRRATKQVSTGPTRLSVPARPAMPERSEPTPGAPEITDEQTRAALAFHERAVQVIAEGGGEDYARQLLDNALKLDPFNVTCRKTLRDLTRAAAGGVLGRWFGSLNLFAIKSKMRLARSTGDWRKVFEHGEQALAYQAGDADTHIELADTATEIGVPTLARWFLEQGCEQAPGNPDLLRALARLHEHLKQWKLAISLWQQVIEIEPINREAHHKINDLSARDMITAGNYGK